MYVKESSQPEYSGWEFFCVSKLEFEELKKKYVIASQCAHWPIPRIFRIL